MAAVEVRFEELVKREGKDIDILRGLVKENSAVQREMKVRTYYNNNSSCKAARSAAQRTIPFRLTSAARTHILIC
jgi:hypothetical protein